MKHMYKLLWSMLALLLGTFTANAGSAWPANYDGVMLQGFYWDSYQETSWSKLEAQSDELSKYFQLIWIPNSAKPASNPGMGYDPVYWFSNYNSSFGTEAQLRSMIKAFKAKGTGMIADVVINHRSGATNWCDFPTETWNGVTYHIGLDGICRTDEASRNGYNVTGNADEGEDFDGSRDLDHTNANVQANCKAYTKFLLEELGYTGFRYDMVKGYAGYYTGQYNAASGTQFSVGEYWDGSYDAVAKWIDQTSEKGGGKSAAFDFPGKYAINEAFASNDMTKLVWKANSTTDQPAGMIHFGYPQYAVTFVDNHDTYRDGSKFNGNVMAANAFILCSPGTPCVFWPHYTANKTAMQALISARRNAGITNTSTVKVLKSTNNCYMAEITGTKGKLAVKIGSAMDSPSGYSNSQIVASGTDYCVWSTSTGGYTPDPVEPDDPVIGGNAPAALYLVGNIEDHSWEPTVSGTIAMTKDGDKFTAKGVSLKYGTSADAYFSFLTAVAPDATAEANRWNVVNGSDRYGASSEDAPIANGGSATITKFGANDNASKTYSWKVDVGVYDITADFSTMKVTISKTGDVVITPDPIDPDPVDPDPVDPTTTRVMHFKGGSSWTKAPSAYVYNEKVSPKVEVFGAWSGKEMTAEGDGWYKVELPASVTSDYQVIFNTAGGEPRYPADMEPGINISFTGAEGWYLLADKKWYDKNPDGGDTPDPIDPDPIDPDPVVDAPAALWIVGNLGGEFNPVEGEAVSMTKSGSKFTASGVELKIGTSADAYFSFITSVAPAGTAKPWDVVNSTDRYGSSKADEALVDGKSTIVKYAAGVDASSAASWKVPVGVYTIEADFSTMTVTATKTGDVVITPDPIDPDPVDPDPVDPTTTRVMHFKGTSEWTKAPSAYVYNDNVTPTVEVFGAWSGKEMTAEGDGWYKVELPASVTSDYSVIFNTAGGAPRYPADMEPGIKISFTGAEGWYLLADKKWYDKNPDGGNTPDPIDPDPIDPDPVVDAPAALWIVGNLGGEFNPVEGEAVSMTKSGSKFTASGVELKIGASADAYFSFITSVAPAGTAKPWDVVNSTDRYGSSESDEALVDGKSTIVKYAAGVDASKAYSWKVPVGVYTIEADFSTMTVTATKTGDVVITPDPIDPDPVDPDPVDPTTTRVMHFKGTSEWTKAPSAYVYNGNVTPTVEVFGAWSGKEMTAEGDGWYKVELPASVTSDYSVIFNTNGGEPRYPADMEPGIKISFTGAEGWYLLADKKWYDKKPDGGDTPDPIDPDPVVDAPAALYLLGNFGGDFSPYEGDNVTMTKNGSKFTASGVELKIGDSKDAYFGFATALAPASVTVLADAWDLNVNASDRYGAATADAAINGSAPMVKYAANDNASKAASWKVPVGVYTIEADFSTMTVTATKTGDVVITPDPIDPDPINPDPVEETITVHFHSAWSGTHYAYVYTPATADPASDMRYATSAILHSESWPGDEMTAEGDGWHAYTLPATADKNAVIVFNNGEDQHPGIDEPGLALDFNGNEGWYRHADLKWYDSKPVDDPEPVPGDVPEKLYVIGNTGGDFSPYLSGMIEMTKSGDVFTAKEVRLYIGDSKDAYFAFATAFAPEETALGAAWDDYVNASVRYGAATKDETLVNDKATIVKYNPGVEASGANSWKVPTGVYDITADFSTMTVTAINVTSAGINGVGADGNGDDARYYNLQGVEVENPSAGLYIVVRGGKATKQLIK